MKVNNVISIDNNKSLNFQAAKPYDVIILKGEAYKRVSSLKNTCKEIFSKLRLKSDLIDGAKSKLGKMKLSDKSVTFNLSDTDSARLAMPRGDEGNLFTIQILRDKKPLSTVIVNEHNQLIESYSLNNETFLSPKNYHQEFVDKTIQTIYDAVDYPLLQLRLYVKQNSSFNFNQTSKDAIVNQTETKKIEKVNSADGSFLPPSSKWGEFSLSEIVKQNAENFKPKQGVKRYSVVPKQTVYQIEGINIPKRPAQTKPKTTSAIKKTEAVQEQTSVENTKKHMDSLPQIITEEIPKSIKKQEVKEISPIKTQTSSLGKVNDDTLAKINEIKNLNNYIKNFLKTKSTPVVSNICKRYPHFVRNGHWGFEFKDLSFLIITNKKFANEEVLSISNSDKTKAINLTLSGKIIDSTRRWSKMIVNWKPRYQTQEQVEETLKTPFFNELIDKTHEILVGFKNHIDTQGWRIRKDNKTLKKDWITIEDSLQQKLKNILNSFNHSKKILQSFSYVQANKAFENNSTIKKTRSGDFEIINPLNSGKNYLFSTSSNRFGNFYKVAKLSEDKKLEKVFIISTDGKIVENISKTRGIKQPFPTGTNASVRYLTEDLNESDSDTLKEILNILEEEIVNYEKYLSDFKSGLRTHVKNYEVQSNKSDGISFDTVKDFLDKTVNEIQQSADRLREITGFKSTLDSVADSLRTKFEEFLKQLKEK